MNSGEDEKTDDQPLPLPQHKWRPGIFTYIITTLALAGVLCWGGVWLWTRSARLAFEAELDAAKSRGEALRFADYQPQDMGAYPGTADYHRALQDLAAYLADFDNPVVSQYWETEGRLETPGIVVIANYTDADLANIRLLRQELTEPRAALSAALDQDIALYLEYGDYFDVIDKRLADAESLRNWARVLSADGHLAISDGDSDYAIAVIEDLLKLSTPHTNVALIGNKFADMAVGGLGVVLTLSLLENVQLTEAQRNRLDQRIAETQSRFRLAPAVLADRATLYELFDGWQQIIQPDESDGLEGLEINGFDAWAYNNFQAVRYNDLTTIFQLTSRGAAFVDQTGPQGHAAALQFEQDLANVPGRSIFAKMTVSNLSGIRESGLRYRQQLRGLRLALRVDAAFRQNGQFPTRLSEVLDAELRTVPPCVLSGKSPGYSVSGNGFLIYSVGTDGVDDGFLDHRDGNRGERGVIKVEYPPQLGQIPEDGG